MASQLIQATFRLYLDCAVKAAKGLYRNWIILVGSVLSLVVLVITALVVSRLGMIGEFIIGIVSAFFTSLLFSWISDTSRKDRLTWSSLWQFDADLFFKVINVGFFLFLIRFFTDTLIRGMNAQAIELLLAMVMAILFNCVSEVVYTHRYDGITALGHSINFIKENWIEWFIPYIILTAPTLGAGAVLLSFLFFTPLFPPAPIFLPWFQDFYIAIMSGMSPSILQSLTGAFLLLYTLWPLALIGLLVLIYCLWFMLFRAHLFIALDTSSRRQRVFNYKK